MNKTIIIQGSSRSEGDTNKVVSFLARSNNFDIVDLHKKNIGHYNYNYDNADDDFIDLITEVINNYDTIIFATPIYWYSMSGTLKVFFDRLSDLLRVHKDLGRKLRGKNMAMLSCSNSDFINPGFTEPFKLSSEYLGMNYLGDLHTYIENDSIPEKVKNNIKTFAKNIKKAL